MPKKRYGETPGYAGYISGAELAEDHTHCSALGKRGDIECILAKVWIFMHFSPQSRINEVLYLTILMYLCKVPRQHFDVALTFDIYCVARLAFLVLCGT